MHITVYKETPRCPKTLPKKDVIIKELMHTIKKVRYISLMLVYC